MKAEIYVPLFFEEAEWMDGCPSVYPLPMHPPTCSAICPICPMLPVPSKRDGFILLDSSHLVITLRALIARWILLFGWSPSWLALSSSVQSPSLQLNLSRLTVTYYLHSLLSDLSVANGDVICLIMSSSPTLLFFLLLWCWYKWLWWLKWCSLVAAATKLHSL